MIAMTLDKTEEEQMREAFERNWNDMFEPNIDSLYSLRRDEHGVYIRNATAGGWASWKAAIAHANSKHSAIIEDRERLAKLAEKMAAEIETLQYRLQGEFDRGMDAARKEIQTVEIGENSPDSLEDWIGDKPILRIQFFSDSGDMSVGIWPSSGWEVSANQNGTVLEELLSSIAAANAAIAMKDSALDMALLDIEGTEWVDVAKQARSATPHQVSEWEEKKLEPLRAEVKLLRPQIANLHLLVHTFMLSYADALSFNEMSTLFAAAKRALDNTQAAADAFMAEHDAKVLEELADWFNAPEQDAWEIAEEIRAKADELRATAKKG